MYMSQSHENEHIRCRHRGHNYNVTLTEMLEISDNHTNYKGRSNATTYLFLEFFIFFLLDKEMHYTAMLTSAPFS